jgi:ankyrin repeat protein
MFLLQHRATKADVPNMDGNTPMHIFAKCWKNPSCDAVFAGLLARGADVNAKNGNGETPLHQAVLNPTVCMLLVELLARSGARVNEPSTSRGATALHYAVQVQKKDLIALLLECGADLCATDLRGQTPLDLARGFGDMPLLALLQDFKQLGEYLDSLGLAAHKTKFFQQRLFVHKLRKLEVEDLSTLGIEPECHRQLLEAFSKLPDASTLRPEAPHTANEQVSGDLGSIGEAFIIDENEVEL